MKQNFKEALKLIANSEGGYSNHKNDPGGPTMRGVTIATYRRYRKVKGLSKPTIAMLKRITMAEVEDIFRTNYWDTVRGDDLPAGIDFMTSDFSYNSGPAQAVKELQRVVTAAGFDTDGADGIVGSFTLAALDSCMKELGEEEVIKRYSAKRLAFMKSLKNWPTFKNGWTTRVKTVEANALVMARGDDTYDRSKVEGAKADPQEAKASSVPGSNSNVATVGAAIATGATTAAGAVIDKVSSVDLSYLPWVIGAFVALTLVGSLITMVILKRNPKEDGAV